ncbi:MAG: hypothetical protein APR55_04730 [Methanolinea sp. SDB]|nr:MAG: hypothetical protein APR55_04730 [Methanolinea sp. SDB]
MKKLIAFTGFIILALLTCGCTTVSQDASPVDTPNLVGNWTGPMYGYIEGSGYTTFSDETITMSVTEQHDRVFSGVMTFSNKVKSWEDKPFAGIIGLEGSTLTIIEEGGGFSSGSVIAPDEIELTYLDIGEPFSIAIDSLKKE